MPQSQPTQPTQPTPSALRQLLYAALPLDADLDALCVDYFPEVMRRFSGGMDRVAKINLLLMLASPESILSALRNSYPQCLCNYPDQYTWHRDQSQPHSLIVLNNEILDGRTYAQFTNSRVLYITIGIGISLMILACTGLLSKLQINRSALICVGALGGFWLIIGLFFANISMFPERQRGKIISTLIVALIMITLILGAYAARSYLSSLHPSIAHPSPSDTDRSGRTWTDDNTPTDLAVSLSDMMIPIDEGLHPVAPPAKLTSKSKTIQPSPVPSVNPDEEHHDLSLPSTRPPIVVPYARLRSEALDEPTPELTPETKNGNMCKNITGSYKVCINQEGTVTEVQAISGIAGSDDQITAKIKTWKYKPRSESVCFVKLIDYSIKDENDCKPKLVQAITMRSRKISGEDPHLSSLTRSTKMGSGMIFGSYKICIGTDGGISDVKVINSIDKGYSVDGEDSNIINVLRTWKYQPQETPVCFVQHLQFVSE